MTDEEILAVQNLEQVFKGITGRRRLGLSRRYPELCFAIERVIGHKDPVLPTAEELSEQLPILDHGRDWSLYREAINTPPPEKLKDVMGKGEPPPEPKILTTDAEYEARLEDLRQKWDAAYPILPPKDVSKT